LIAIVAAGFVKFLKLFFVSQAVAPIGLAAMAAIFRPASPICNALDRLPDSTVLHAEAEGAPSADRRVRAKLVRN
jgi:hypothetical protein